MKLQVLVSTVNANVNLLVKKMNINSDAIIINQCDKNSYEEFEFKKNLIKVYNFAERGIGLSRNNALMRADADIVLFADDDEVLVDNYQSIVVDEFEKNRKASMIVFNINAISKDRKIYNIRKKTRIHKFNCLRYGAVRFAVKLTFLRKKNILFSNLFGGGCKYGSGEDSLFIYDCLNKKGKVYSSPTAIANVDMSTSSWFEGYNEKFFYDKGALFCALHGKLAPIFMVRFLLKHRSYKKNSFYECFLQMMKGYNEFKEDI